jgi:hypothetical protein
VDSLHWWDYLVWIILATWFASRLGFLYLARDMPAERKRIWRGLMGWAIVAALYCFGRLVH